MKRLLALGIAVGVMAPIAVADPATAETAHAAAHETTSVAAVVDPGSATIVAKTDQQQTKKTKTKHKKQRRKRRRHRIQAPDFDVTATAAWKYGAMTQAACEAELTSRSVPFTREEASGVRDGVRLNGPLRGVTFRTRLSEARRATSHWEIADCRLVLALDDFAQLLVAHDIVEVRHYSMYRTSRAGRPGSQHRGGLAIDAAVFTRRDGTKLDVEDDWSGRIGAATCGAKARPRKPTANALALRAILCEVAAARIFNVILTPNHNRAHRNHFHLDVTPGAKWFIVD